jgi:NADP-dependent 3-hydroxy acid dehydrogenase YdfG
MRNPEKETELTQLDNVLVTRLDVMDKNSISKAVAKGLERFRNIDVLVNNAGYVMAGEQKKFQMQMYAASLM